MKDIFKQIGIFAGLALFIFAVIFFNNQKPQQALAGISDGPFNIIGTRVGTTTTEGGFYKTAANNGTTSVPINIGRKADTAVITLQLIAASTTPSNIFTWAVEGSNDFNCETATTTTTASNQVVKKDIHWYTVGGTDRGQLVSTSFLSASTTGNSATGTVITLTNLAYQCLQFEANGSSSAALVQLVAKSLTQ